MSTRVLFFVAMEKETSQQEMSILLQCLITVIRPATVHQFDTMHSSTALFTALIWWPSGPYGIH